MVSYTKHLATIDRPFRIAPSGVFTIRGPYGHRTMSIERQDEKAEFAPGERLIFLLTAGDPDDYRSWTSVAIVKDPKGVVDTPPDWKPGTHRDYSFVIVFKKFREAVQGTLAKMLMEMLTTGRREYRSEKDDKVHVYEVLCARACLRCGKTLSTPSSLERGIGPECASRIGID